MTKQQRKTLAFDIATDVLVIRSQLKRIVPNAWQPNQLALELLEIERRLSSINELAREIAQ